MKSLPDSLPTKDIEDLIDFCIRDLLDDNFLKEVCWQDVQNGLKNLISLEEKWKNKGNIIEIHPNMKTFLSLTNICSGNICFEVKKQNEQRTTVSFPLYHKDKLIFTCEDFKNCSMNQTYKDYLDKFNENQIKIAGRYTNYSSQSYLHSERALLMFCFEYAGDIAQKFNEKCSDFEAIEKITIKMYSERCSCEHCILLLLNSNSNTYGIICRLIHIIHDQNIASRKSLDSPQENLQKIMAFSGENKFSRIELLEDQNENFLIDVNNIRNYQSASFLKKSLKIPAKTINEPRSYFISGISLEDDQNKLGGSYHQEFLPKFMKLK